MYCNIDSIRGACEESEEVSIIIALNFNIFFIKKG